MRLLTLNTLKCTRKDVTDGRLRLVATKVEHVLFDVHVIEGQLVCEESGQTFPIEEGRPNMMLDEGLL
ncbi:hypothetical protein JL722_13099 [Aureococcus anophagefferens]|nr:hypothetical protein JL722_13099 [Aureococcus anophagefferens]